MVISAVSIKNPYRATFTKKFTAIIVSYVYICWRLRWKNIIISVSEYNDEQWYHEKSCYRCYHYTDVWKSCSTHYSRGTYQHIHSPSSPILDGWCPIWKMSTSKHRELFKQNALDAPFICCAKQMSRRRVWQRRSMHWRYPWLNIGWSKMWKYKRFYSRKKTEEK